jgi:omega-6 fatty acid desaturase (delta-12 desaturase)
MIWIGSGNPLAIVLLAVPVGGLLVRFFIIQHDCGHGSFVASRRWNDIIGRAMSVLTVTPYGLWRRVHAQHHAGSGNLDRRGAGDINTLTVREYLGLTPGGRLRYRIYRNPAFLFLLGVPAFFLLIQRTPWLHPLPPRDTWKSVMGLNAAIVAFYGGLGWLIGYGLLVLIAVPAIVVASCIGGWLFFIQHQFEDTHWEPGSAWDFQIAAVQGSSYYDLPPVLNRFTGNIGLHHIHHLNSMIPNYRLQECLAASPEFQALNRITLWESFKCARLTLWDEDQRRLVGFGDVAAQSA